jgi:hypothetical protein
MPFFLRETDPRKVKPGEKSQLAEGVFFERFETAKTANQEKKANWQKRLVGHATMQQLPFRTIWLGVIFSKFRRRKCE